MYAVMGATSRTGGVVLGELRRRGLKVRALARDPERATALWTDGIEVAIAAPGDADALTTAFTGVDGACVIASSVATPTAIVQAIGRAGVRHVVAVSPHGGRRDFEDALLATGACVTFVRQLNAARHGGAREAGRLAALCLMEGRP